MQSRKREDYGHTTDLTAAVIDAATVANAAELGEHAAVQRAGVEWVRMLRAVEGEERGGGMVADSQPIVTALCRTANTTACSRDSTPSLRRIFLMWVRAVSALICSRCAISLAVSPSVSA